MFAPPIARKIVSRRLATHISIHYHVPNALSRFALNAYHSSPYSPSITSFSNHRDGAKQGVPISNFSTSGHEMKDDNDFFDTFDDQDFAEPLGLVEDDVSLESLMGSDSEQLDAIDFRKKKKKVKQQQQRRVTEAIRDEYNISTARGGRKNAKARVWIKPGTGECFVNQRNMADYFNHWSDRGNFVKPFQIVDQLGKFDVWAVVRGGGLTGQAEAVQLAISRALVNFDPDSFHSLLKKEGLLMRDRRMVERQKPGKPGARKSFTWVKR